MDDCPEGHFCWKGFCILFELWDCIENDLLYKEIEIIKLKNQVKDLEKEVEELKQILGWDDGPIGINFDR